MSRPIREDDAGHSNGPARRPISPCRAADERYAMSKKTMLLAIVAAGMALFALPSTVSAAEIHFEGATGVKFTAHGPGNAPTVGSEPTITCETGTAQGEFTTETTGNVSGYGSGCHTIIFGFTAKCHTTGSPLDNTIASSGTFHLITYVNGATSVPAMLGTSTATTVICAGISNIETTGSVISTITKPACGESSKTATGKAAATSGVQNEKTYTGVQYFGKARTSGGAYLETGLDAEATITFSTALKLVCT
jgi:hypothetical protein